MEDEVKMNYEEAYNNAIQENVYLRQQLSDHNLENVIKRIEVLLKVVDNEKLAKKTINLAEWHIQQMLAKPESHE